MNFCNHQKKIFDSQVVYQFALKVAPNLPFTFQLQWKMTRHVNFSSSCAAVVWFFLMHASKAVAWSLYNIQLSRDDWTFGKLWIWIWLIIWTWLAHHFIEHFIHRWNPCRTVSQECAVLYAPVNLCVLGKRDEIPFSRHSGRSPGQKRNPHRI